MGSNAKSSNFRNPDLNPCIKEADLVKNCLETNSYSHSKCTKYFENYKECKKFWGVVKRSRNRKGITPSLPTEKERQAILKLREKEAQSFSAKE